VRNWIIRWITSGIALAIVGHLNVGVSYKSLEALAVATVFIGLANSLIKPVLSLLTMPLNCMTFGLFGFVLNALLFYVAGNAVNGFKVESLLGALIGSILMGILSGILNAVLVERNSEE
jgi:putative membrane protein